MRLCRACRLYVLYLLCPCDLRNMLHTVSTVCESSVRVYVDTIVSSESLHLHKKAQSDMQPHCLYLFMWILSCRVDHTCVTDARAYVTVAN